MSGLTENYNQWEKTGTTQYSGFTGGTITWDVNEIIPVFKYNTYVKSTGTTYINTYKKFEDYIFDDLQKKIFNNIEYDNLYYNIVNLNHCYNTYGDISNYFKKSIFGNYFDCYIIDNKLIMTPIRNPYDIYFDYDIFEIMFIGEI